VVIGNAVRRIKMPRENTPRGWTQVRGANHATELYAVWKHVRPRRNRGAVHRTSWHSDRLGVPQSSRDWGGVSSRVAGPWLACWRSSRPLPDNFPWIFTVETALWQF
jgi:hypothetical protein